MRIAIRASLMLLLAAVAVAADLPADLLAEIYAAQAAQDPALRAAALTVAAGHCGKRGWVTAARTVLDEVCAMLDDLPEDRPQLVTWGAVASTYAETGWADRALAVAEDFPENRYGAAQLILVAQALARARPYRHEEAARLARRIWAIEEKVDPGQPSYWPLELADMLGRGGGTDTACRLLLACQDAGTRQKALHSFAWRRFLADDLNAATAAINAVVPADGWTEGIAGLAAGIAARLPEAERADFVAGIDSAVGRADLYIAGARYMGSGAAAARRAVAAWEELPREQRCAVSTEQVVRLLMRLHEYWRAWEVSEAVAVPAEQFKVRLALLDAVRRQDRLLAQKVTQALAAQADAAAGGLRGDDLGQFVRLLCEFGDTERARRIARRIRDDRARVRALKTVAEALTRAGVRQEGLAMVEKIAAPAERIDALCATLYANQQTPPEERRRTLAQAEALLPLVAGARQQRRARSRIMWAWADTDREQMARYIAGFEAELTTAEPDTADEILAILCLYHSHRGENVNALDCVAKIRNEHQRFQYLTRLTERLARTGWREPEEQRILDIVGRFQDAQIRRRAWYFMAHHYVSAGALPRARECLEETGDKHATVKLIASLHWHRHRLPAGVWQELMKELRRVVSGLVTEELTSGEWSGIVWGLAGEDWRTARDIADKHLSAGDLDRVRPSFVYQALRKDDVAAAEAIAAAIHTVSERARAYTYLAEASAEAGDFDHAFAQLNEVEDPSMRDRLLVRLAGPIARAPDRSDLLVELAGRTKSPATRVAIVCQLPADDTADQPELRRLLSRVRDDLDHLVPTPRFQHELIRLEAIATAVGDPRLLARIQALREQHGFTPATPAQ